MGECARREAFMFQSSKTQQFFWGGCFAALTLLYLLPLWLFS